MKLNPFHRQTSAVPPKAPATPAPRPEAGPPPRVWSLLLPPGFSRDRR